MAIPFEMVGKISISKESDKFKPYTETIYDSGWVSRHLMFNAVCGDNRHMLSIKGGSFKDGHGDVYLFSKATVDEAGHRKKGESFKIPFADRFQSPRIEEVAEFKKFVFDLEEPGRRYLLHKLADHIHEGKSVAKEELKEAGLETEAEVIAALNKSQKKRHEYVTEWDFAEFVKKVIDSGKYKDCKFKITGDITITYSDIKGRFYTNYTPRRIYLAKEEEPAVSTAAVTLLYNANSLDDGSVDEKGRYYINGYVFEYDQARKKNIPCPYTISLAAAREEDDDKTKKIAQLYKKMFVVEDDTWKQLGAIVNLVNGAQKAEIDESMLTDLQQELLLLGEITLEDIRKELGGEVYGERIQESRFLKLAKGYSKGREDTVFTDDDFVIKPLEEIGLPKEVEDLFADDMDDEFL